MSSTGIPKQEHGSTKTAESGLEVHPEVSECLYETTTDGQGTQQQATGTILLSKRGPNIRIPAFRDDTEHRTVPTFCSDEEGL